MTDTLHTQLKEAHRALKNASIALSTADPAYRADQLCGAKITVMAKNNPNLVPLNKDLAAVVEEAQEKMLGLVEMRKTELEDKLIAVETLLDSSL